MATKNRAILKSYFLKNMIPTEGDFADLIDSMLNVNDDALLKSSDGSLSIEAAGPNDANSEKKVLSFFQKMADPNPAWSISLNPRSNHADVTTAHAGLSINDSANNSRLFIDNTSGNVGIGTITPLSKLHITGNASVLGIEGNDHAIIQWYPQGISAGQKAYMGYGTANDPAFTIQNDAGRMHISGSEYLFLLNKSGVIVGKEFGGNGNLSVEGNLIVSATGSVGIGNAAPQSKLHVTGNAGVLNLEGQDHATIQWFPQGINAGQKGSMGYFTANDPAFTIQNTGRMHIAGGELLYLLNQGGVIVGKEYSGNGNLTVEGNLIVNGTGNVGIGNNITPLYKLHVVDTGGFGPESANGVSLAGKVPLVAQSNGTVIGILNGDGRQAFALNINDNSGTTNSRGVPVFHDKYDGVWHAALALKLGNVGIGNTNPQSKLHVTSNAGVLNLEGTDHAYIQWYPQGFSAGRKGYLGYPNSGATNLDIHNDLGSVTIGASDILYIAAKNGAVISKDAGLGNLTVQGDATVSGKVTLGDTTVSPVLHVQGEVNADGVVRSRGVILLSDINMKQDVQTITHPIENLLALRGVRFQWKDEGINGKYQLGLIAQELETVFPELVETGSDGLKSVNYAGLAAPLIEAIKAQQTQIDELRAEIHSLKNN